MQRVEADRNNVHQHRPRQQCAGDAATEQKEILENPTPPTGAKLVKTVYRIEAQAKAR